MANQVVTRTVRARICNHSQVRDDRETARLRFKRAYEELTDERWDGEWWVIPDRPAGMHRSTYAEQSMLMMKGRHEKEDAFFRELRKMHTRAQR